MILVTGCNGQLGRALRKILPKNKAIFIDRDDLDITDKKTVEDFFQKIKPKIVIHTAAFTDVDGSESDSKTAFRVNEQGTKNIAESCQKLKAVLVYISTDYIFDGQKKSPYKETDKPHPLSVYGDSKLAGEKQVQKTLKNYYIVRTSWLYGEGKNFVQTILKLAQEKKELKVIDDQIGSPTYALDLAGAIWQLSQKKPAFGIYHMTNFGKCSWCQFAREIIDIKKLKTKIIPITSKEWQQIKSDAAPRPKYSILSKEKIKRLGINLQDWQKGLREYLKREK